MLFRSNVFYRHRKEKQKLASIAMNQVLVSRELIVESRMPNSLKVRKVNKEIFLHKSQNTWLQTSKQRKGLGASFTINNPTIDSAKTKDHGNRLQGIPKHAQSIEPSQDREQIDLVKRNVRRMLHRNQGSDQSQEQMIAQMRSKLQNSMSDYRKAQRQDLRYSFAYDSPLGAKLSKINKAMARKNRSKGENPELVDRPRPNQLSA